jgi:type I restriction enzyme S subunit
MNHKTGMPQLRFPEFEKNWEEKKFGSLGEFKGGGTPSTTNENHWNGNIPWISSSDIYDDNLFEINIHRFLNEDAIQESATKIIPANSILLVSRVGVGKLAINKIELCTSQDFCNFIPNNCNSYFVGYFLISRKQILVNFSQGTSIKGFTTGDIKTLPIMLPTLPEQQKIASFLSAIDEKTLQLSRKKELLEQYKKGIMQQLFSGKLRFKDENGNDYADWEEIVLGDLVQIKSGNSPSDYNFIEDGVNPFIKVEELNNCSKYQNKSRFYSNDNKNLIESFSVIFPKRGAAILNNKVRINDCPILMDSNMMALIPLRKELDVEFLYSKIVMAELYKIADTSSIPQINNKHIEPYVISTPCLKEQQKIANFLSSIDTKIKSTNQQINQTQSFKKGLLQQMFV